MVARNGNRSPDRSKHPGSATPNLGHQQHSGRLPFSLRVRSEFENVGRKPLGNGFTAAPVRELRIAVLRSFRDGKMDLGLNWLIAVPILSYMCAADHMTDSFMRSVLDSSIVIAGNLPTASSLAFADFAVGKEQGIIRPSGLILFLRCTTNALPEYCRDGRLSRLRPFPSDSCGPERRRCSR